MDDKELVDALLKSPKVQKAVDAFRSAQYEAGVMAERERCLKLLREILQITDIGGRSMMGMLERAITEAPTHEELLSSSPAQPPAPSSS